MRSLAADAANERDLGRVRRHLLHAQHRIRVERDEAPREPVEHRDLARGIVVAADPLEHQRRRRALEAHRVLGRGVALLEHELSVAPGEDLEQLGLGLLDQRARQVVRRQRAHLDQDLALAALLLLHALDRFGQRLAGDHLLAEQDLAQAFAEQVRSHGDRIALDERHDLLRAPVQQQQRAGRAPRVQALQQAREGDVLEVVGEVGLLGRPATWRCARRRGFRAAAPDRAATIRRPPAAPPAGAHHRRRRRRRRRGGRLGGRWRCRRLWAAAVALGSVGGRGVTTSSGAGWNASGPAASR